MRASSESGGSYTGGEASVFRSGGRLVRVWLTGRGGWKLEPSRKLQALMDRKQEEGGDG